MTVRCKIAALLALALLLAGCGDRSGQPLLAETDEPYYAEGMQLKRQQGRLPEALSAFLKVIDRRGTKGAPQSHLEAGEIYLVQMKDPVEAYHHFRRFLVLEPKSKEAEFVRGRVRVALREFARSIPANPLEDQSVRLQVDDDLVRLRRENDELRAQLATLRGGGAVPVPRAPRMITLPEEIRATPAPAPLPVSPPPPDPSPISAAPQRREPAPAATTAPQRAPASAPARTSGRTHTVRPKETLFAISRQYGVTVQELMAANGISNPSAIPVGTVLKIPGGR
ncbi:MAG: LysM peptidoglycan-binding domain-containing protein [Opitutaceae bacterium]|nr:LysM peptidoglycan-binding domain-containing protein [Opitutaceae bacterium]